MFVRKETTDTPKQHETSFQARMFLLFECTTFASISERSKNLRSEGCGYSSLTDLSTGLYPSICYAFNGMAWSPDARQTCTYTPHGTGTVGTARLRPQKLAAEACTMLQLKPTYVV